MTTAELGVASAWHDSESVDDHQEEGEPIESLHYMTLMIPSVGGILIFSAAQMQSTVQHHGPDPLRHRFSDAGYRRLPERRCER